MLRINFDKVGNWYEGIEFENSHLVTKANHNRDLGISSIRLSAPRGESATVLASATIYFTNGLELFGTVYSRKDGKGLTFGTEQRKYENDDKSVGYADINVRVPMAIQAQVLRYASTKVVDIPTQAPVAAPTQAPVQQAPQQQTFQQQAPVAPAAPAQDNTALLMNAIKNNPALTVDQMNAIIAGM